jgi:hypothetical protein
MSGRWPLQNSPKRPAVRVEDVVEAQVAVVLEDDLARLVLRQVRHLQLGQLSDHRVDLHPPLRVEVVPVLEVVAGPLLEVPGPLRDLLRVGDRVAGDVDVAVDAAVVDPHRRRDREDAVLPRADPVVGRVDAEHVERRHRQREVHRVPEPESLLVGLPPALVEQRVVGVHLLPALAAGRRLDLVGVRERS